MYHLKIDFRDGDYVSAKVKIFTEGSVCFSYLIRSDGCKVEKLIPWGVIRKITIAEIPDTLPDRDFEQALFPGINKLYKEGLGTKGTGK